jgi:hypothetical protein
MRVADAKTPKTAITGRVTARYGAFQRFGADVELKPATARNEIG